MPSVPDTLEWRGCKFFHQGDWTYRWDKQDNHPEFRIYVISTIHGLARPLEWTARVGYGSSPSFESPLVALDFALERHLERLQELEESVAKARKVTDWLIQGRDV